MHFVYEKAFLSKVGYNSDFQPEQTPSKLIPLCLRFPLQAILIQNGQFMFSTYALRLRSRARRTKHDLKKPWVNLSFEFTNLSMIQGPNVRLFRILITQGLAFEFTNLSMIRDSACIWKSHWTHQRRHIQRELCFRSSPPARHEVCCVGPCQTTDFLLCQTTDFL